MIILDKKKAIKEAVGNEKLPHMGDNVHAFHGAGLPGLFKKGYTMNVSVFFIILLIGTFLSTRWSGVVSCHFHPAFLSIVP